MPQTLWFPTGAWKVETDTRHSHRCREDRHHKIEKDDPYLVVTDSGTGSAWNYCQPCAIALLDRIAAGIRELHSELSEKIPGQAQQ